MISTFRLGTKAFAGLVLGVAGALPLLSWADIPADAPPANPAPVSETATRDSRQAKEERTVLDVSRKMWRWMSDRNVDALAALYHEKSAFVHMGATMTRAAELDVIRSGSIQYKRVDIQESSARIVGATAAVLTKMRLGAVVGGNEVNNPFMVTEVYVRQGGNWQLLSLSFTRLLGN